MKQPALFKGAPRENESEASIQAAIERYLLFMRIPFTVSDASRSFGPDGKPRRSKVDAGWPDLTAVIPPTGRMLAIEVKSTKGRLRPAQEKVLAELERAGACVVVARSVDDVRAILNEEQAK